MYSVPVDLANNIGAIEKTSFKTKESENPISFKLNFLKQTDTSKILQTLSLITGQNQDKFEVKLSQNLDEYNSLDDSIK